MPADTRLDGEYDLLLQSGSSSSACWLLVAADEAGEHRVRLLTELPRKVYFASKAAVRCSVCAFIQA